MPKGFKEYFSAGGFAMGTIDGVTPMVSLGPTDRPPVASKSKDSRSMGLPEQGRFKAKIMKKLQKPISDYLKKKKLKEDGMVGPGMGTYEPSGSLNPQRGTTKKNIADEKKEDANRIPRKSGQPAGSDKHSDLYTDENPKGTIQGLGFTDAETAQTSVNKIKGSGKTHAHKIQAAIAMSQRAKVASQRAKDPEKKKDLGQAHKIYQNYIDTNKKNS